MQTIKIITKEPHTRISDEGIFSGVYKERVITDYNPEIDSMRVNQDLGVLSIVQKSGGKDRGMWFNRDQWISVEWEDNEDDFCSDGSGY